MKRTFSIMGHYGIIAVNASSTRQYVTPIGSVKETEVNARPSTKFVILGVK